MPLERQMEIIDRYKKGQSFREIMKEMNTSSTAIKKYLTEHGVETRKCAGENHHMWKGGRVGKGDDYIGIWMPEHPRADHQNYVYEHTLVIEKHLGRLPGKGEVVHHINGDKHDNRIENLYLCNISEHKAAHWSLEKHLKFFLENDIVEFVNGKYELKIQ